MSGQCWGSDTASQNVEEATDSTEIAAISVSCTEDKVMYFSNSPTGWWAYRLGHNPSAKRWSAPQHLKVLVDGKKSCVGERYYFKVLEGPWVIKSKHYNGLAPSYAQGNVLKKYKGKDVLIEANPHMSAANLKVVYSRHQVLEYGNFATPAVIGELNYAGVVKTVSMVGDLIAPNVKHPISIPDEKHNDDAVRKKYGRTDFFDMWFRIDAPTAKANLAGNGQPGDRYFHLGLGSAGCFTNLYPSQTDWSINDRDWNTIAKTLSQARVGENQLYVGYITFQIPETIYKQIHANIITFAQKHKITKYI